MEASRLANIALSTVLLTTVPSISSAEGHKASPQEKPATGETVTAMTATQLAERIRAAESKASCLSHVPPIPTTVTIAYHSEGKPEKTINVFQSAFVANPNCSPEEVAQQAETLQEKVTELLKEQCNPESCDIRNNIRVPVPKPKQKPLPKGIIRT